MHLLCYVVDESGSKFYDSVLSVLNESHKEYAILNKDSNFKNGFIETKLFDESITIELTGKTCVVRLYIKYAQFIFLKDRKERVMSFEMQFVDLLSHSDHFYRVDESLIEDYYLEIQNEFWYMEFDSFKKFSKWIENQEAMHWKKITYNNYGFSG